MVRDLSPHIPKEVREASGLLQIHIQFFTGGEVRVQSTVSGNLPRGLEAFVAYVLKEGRIYRNSIGFALDPYEAIQNLAERLGIGTPQMPEVPSA